MDLVGVERIDTGDCTRMNCGEYNAEKDIAVTEDVILKKAVCKVHI